MKKDLPSHRHHGDTYQLAKKPRKVQTHISRPEASEVNKPRRSPDMIQAPGVLIARYTNNINANLQNHQKILYHITDKSVAI
jgi:hypothetical protein